MRKTRPGADRIGMRLLDASLSAYASALVLHGKECHKCMTADKDPFAHCGTWWEIKTELHRMQKQKRLAVSDVIPGQETLPGMGDTG